MPDQPPVIIDGYNLIKRVDHLAARVGGAGGLESARSYLLGWLRRYQTVRQRRVVLVLDGPRSGRSDFGPVEVRYAPSADEAVAALVTPGAMVVTSDLGLRAAAAAKGADVVSSEDFWLVVSRQGPAAPRYQAGRRTAVGGRDGDDAGEDAGGGGRDGQRRTGNPRRRSKADRRREQEHAALLRKI